MLLRPLEHLVHAVVGGADPAEESAPDNICLEARGNFLLEQSSTSREAAEDGLLGGVFKHS
jgi:hypothetical protein